MLTLEATGILTLYVEPGVTALFNACNSFNELVRLEMTWTVRHHCPVGERFTFNCYRHWAHLLLLQTGNAPFIILSREGIAQGDPLLMVLYRITLVPLEEELRDADTTLLSPFYINDAEFDGSTRKRAAQLHLLMDQGPDQGYFPEPAK